MNGRKHAAVHKGNCFAEAATTLQGWEMHAFMGPTPVYQYLQL